MCNVNTIINFPGQKVRMQLYFMILEYVILDSMAALGECNYEMTLSASIVMFYFGWELPWYYSMLWLEVISTHQRLLCFCSYRRIQEERTIDDTDWHPED